MGKIDKKTFEELLKENKDRALEKLLDKRDKEGYVKIGNKTYKVFAENEFGEDVQDELFAKNQGCAAVIGCKLTYEKKIYRSDFKDWYFIYETTFYGVEFVNEVIFDTTKFVSNTYFIETNFTHRANFRMTKFFNEVSFTKANFKKYASFYKAKFFGSKVELRFTKFEGDASFREAEFKGYTEFGNTEFTRKAYFVRTLFTDIANFDYVKFNNDAYFKKAMFRNNSELSLYNTVFEKSCVLLVQAFGLFVDFRGADFKRPALIKWTELCEEKERYEHKIFRRPRPDKILVYDKEGKENTLKSKENLNAVKQIFNRNGDSEGEDHFLYWFKVYSRKCKKTNWFSKYLDLFLLEKLTGYFTKPWRVFLTIVGTISFFTFLYCLPWCSIKYVPTKEVLWNDLTLSLKSIDDVWSFFEHLGKTLYFSAITFSTIGYGDYQPIGFWTMLLAATEGIIGVLLMSTFLVTLTRKVLR